MLGMEMSNPDFPEEIVMNILSRLPVMSLLQFRCVSKQWRSLISDTHFIRSHLSTSLLSSNHHRVLIPTSPLRSLDYSASSEEISSASIKLDCPFVKSNSLIKILGSCYGLVCLLVDSGKIIIYNPSTRQSKALPPSHRLLGYSNEIDFVYGFGCGLTPHDFKVVRFPQFARDCGIVKCEVFGVENSSWSSGDLIHSFDFVDMIGTFLNGSLHWVARRHTGDHEVRVVASFNLSEEVFEEMSLPLHRTRFPFYGLGVLKGCLYVISDNSYCTHVDVWVMKEYGSKTSWTKFVTVPRDMGAAYITYMTPLSFLNENEVLLEIDLKSFVVCDTKKKTFRKVVTHDDHNWIGDAVVYVESLVSPHNVY